MVKVKNLYMGSFNFNKELIIERCYAYSEAQAKTLFCQRLAKKKGVPSHMIFSLFDGHKDNFRIKTEIEFFEHEEE